MSKDRSLKEWDLSPNGFQDTHIKCIGTWSLPAQFIENDIKVAWIGSNGDEQHICLSESSNIHFYKLIEGQLKQVEYLEDAHSGEVIDKLLYVYDNKLPEKKGILFSQSEKKLFSWKPKYT